MAGVAFEVLQRSNLNEWLLWIMLQKYKWQHGTQYADTFLDYTGQLGFEHDFIARMKIQTAMRRNKNKATNKCSLWTVCQNSELRNLWH